MKLFNSHRTKRIAESSNNLPSVADVTRLNLDFFLLGAALFLPDDLIFFCCCPPSEDEH